MAGEELLGQCSDPLRYVPVVEAAERAVARLEREYDVRRVEGTHLDPALSAIRPGTEIVRLVPNNQGVPVTLALEKGAFAAVILRIGKSWTGCFPSCGCDYCARPDDGPEQVEHIVEELENRLREVSEGTVTEYVTRDGQHDIRVQIDDRRSWESGSNTLFEPAPDIEVPDGGRWEPWERRKPT